MSQTADRRERLKKAYLYVVNNWAVSTKSVEKAIAPSTGAPSLLRSLEAKGLLVSTNVNGERELTWQSNYDIENSDVKVTRKNARADFDKAYPKGEKVPEGRSGGKGATGAKYTDAQLKDAAKRRKAGESFKAIGAALDIKATAHLAKTLREKGLI